jgi:hypothetical protein
MHAIRHPHDAAETAPRTPSFDYVPNLDEIPSIATGLRTAWGVGTTARLDLESICDRLEIEVAKLSLGASKGGAQGFLIPKAEGGFKIAIDPEPRQGWRGIRSEIRDKLERHRMRFLVCHELAHSVFYEKGPVGPRRLVHGSEQQEAFCDELARALLVPRDAAAALPFHPQSVLTLQHQFDVSMEIALRSSVAAHCAGGVGWLLLQREGEMRVQWTSAERRLTGMVLKALRKLAMRAAHAGTATDYVAGTNRLAHALFLKPREQVIVTLSHSRPG